MKDINHGSDVDFFSARPIDGKNREPEVNSTEFFDATGLGESISLLRRITLFINESLALGEGVNLAKTVNINFSESINVSENSQAILAGNFSISESARVSASASIALGAGECGAGQGGVGGITNVAG